MGEWNHRMCGECWILEQNEKAATTGAVRWPVLAPDPSAGACCFCEGRTTIGLYVRRDPRTLSCRHPEDE